VAPQRRPDGTTNLMTLCEDCHSLVHDRLLIVRGGIPDRLRFTDAQGRDLRDLGDTIEAATTDPDRLPDSFRRRFALREHLDFHGPQELAEVLRRAAAGHGLELADDAVRLPARVSQDVPREGLALLRSVCDEAYLIRRGLVRVTPLGRELRSGTAFRTG
jgi:Holliday junction resolvasome RuvABC ATP-dependent DNA helicase subunit